MEPEIWGQSDWEQGFPSKYGEWSLKGLWVGGKGQVAAAFIPMTPL